MCFISFLIGNQYPVAEFYAGLMHATFDVEVGHELQECMVQDENLTETWDHALKHLSKGKKDKWEKELGQAIKATFDNMDACAENPKIATFGPKLEAWWVDFWSQPDALEIVEHNFKEEWLKVSLEVLAMRTKWEFGYYHAAGKTFGHFWNNLIGKPDWSDHQDTKMVTYEPVNASAKGGAVAKLQGNSLKFLGFDFTQKLEACITPDEVEFVVMDA